jgi:molybdenum cofactor cytidylyltransferase
VAGEIRGLLLCGGQASRFGGDKLLCGDPPIAAEAARHLKDALGNALAIIPLGKSKLRAVLEAAGCEVLETDRTTRGMSGSLAAGVEAAEEARGWIVALGDMPRVSEATIREIARALDEGATIAAPVDAQGRRGHPVGFSDALREELLSLEGDVGARSVLARHAHAIRALPTGDNGIFIDIDTKDDLDVLTNGRKA